MLAKCITVATDELTRGDLHTDDTAIEAHQGVNAPRGQAHTAHIIAKRGADDTTWHLMNTAADYEQGGTPGQISRQMTPGEEREMHSMPPIPEHDDSDIPF